MTTRTKTHEDVDTIFNSLSHQHRRYALQLLEATEKPIAVADLAMEVAAWENDTTVTEIPNEEAKRVYVSLHHVHIPKLDDANLVQYNSDRGTVEFLEDTGKFTQYWEHLPVE